MEAQTTGATAKLSARACLAVVPPGERVGEDLADAFGAGLVRFSVLQHLPQSGLLRAPLELSFHSLRLLV